MSLFVETLTGLFKGVGKLASGVGKGLEEGFDELSHIPANHRHAKRDKLSGRYTVDITKNRWGEKQKLPHKTVTIQFSGGSFEWDIEELDGKILEDKYWESLAEEVQVGINKVINGWALDLYKKKGLKSPY